MAADAVNLIPEPRGRRHLGDEELIAFWRDGREPGRRHRSFGEISPHLFFEPGRVQCSQNCV